MPKKPHNIIQLFLVIFLGIFCVTLFNFPAYSGEVEDLENQINQTNEELAKKKGILSDIEKKIAEISGSNSSLSQKISLINDEINKLKKNIDSTEADLNKKIAEIEEKQALLEKKKESIDTFSSDLYIQSRYRMSQFFLSRDSWDSFVEGLFVKKRAITVLRDEVEKINGEFISLAESREALEKQKTELEEQKGDLDKSYALLAAEKARLQKELNAQIASKTSVSSQINKLTSQLSNLQKTLLYTRQGGTSVDINTIPVGGSDLGSFATFTSKAPVGSFGVFSIGAYTHRNGMSQYGAKARAEAGQTYTQILDAYYPDRVIKNATIEDIKVLYCDTSSKDFHCPRAGYNVEDGCVSPTYKTYKFETEYLYRLGEMPEYFHIEALKAQAIAARTYALRVTNYGASAIRADTCHQYVAGVKTGTWKTAVDATAGKVLKSGSSLAVTQYAAVHGGWINGGVNGGVARWDVYDDSKVRDFSNTWDSKSGISWIYRSWYRRDTKNSNTKDSNSCYRYPWLSGQEMADIVNAASRLTDIGGSGSSDSRIYPIHDRCHSDGNPYSFTEMRNKSSSKFTKVILVQVSRSSGNTNSIKFVNEDGREITISGSYFKLAYNLRAPGYLSIPQSGFVHVDIQKKL